MKVYPRRRRQSHRRRRQPGRRLELPRLGRGARTATARGSRTRAQRYAGSRRFPCLSSRYQPRQPLVLPQNRNLKRPAWLNQVTRYHNRGDIDFDSCSAGVLRAGRLLRARRHLHRAAVRRERAREGVRRLDPRVPGGRLPRRHGASTSTARSSAAGRRSPRRRARRRRAGLRDLRRGLPHGRVDLSVVRARPRRCRTFSTSRSRTRSSATRAARQARAASRPGSRTTTTSALPSGLAPTPATFLGNHDIGRAARRSASRRGRPTPSCSSASSSATSLLYLLRGAPVVYYGDEVGMIGRGGDKAARQDMFPTQVARVADRATCRLGRRSARARPSTSGPSTRSPRTLRALEALRERYPALATGAVDRAARATRALLGVSRIDRERAARVPRRLQRRRGARG